MKRWRLTIICIALVQSLALALWGSAAQARHGYAPMSASIADAGTATEAAAPCPDGTADADCPSGCCHGDHCDQGPNCIGLNGATTAILPAAAVTSPLGAPAAIARVATHAGILAGQSIPPPPRPPNG